MKTRRHLTSRRSVTVALLALLAADVLTAALRAQDRRKNPASKLFVTDLNGEAQIDTGDNIQDLTKQSVYTAQGAVIETKKAERAEDKDKHFSTMVFSNGTGAYFEQDTRVEMRRFQQEPFTPNRNDMEVEPSISQTQAFVARGTVALCNSKLVGGSNMNYQTQLAQVAIRGQKIVIESQDEITKVSMLDGESTVKGSGPDLGGTVLRAGEQALIRRQGNAAPQILVQKIPPAEMQQLDDKLAQACMAKKPVYFEVRERAASDTSAPATATSTEEAAATAAGTGAPGAITAFDGNNATTSTSNVVREIIAVPVVPVELPVNFTVSPAQIPGTGRGSGG